MLKIQRIGNIIYVGMCSVIIFVFQINFSVAQEGEGSRIQFVPMNNIENIRPMLREMEGVMGCAALGELSQLLRGGIEERQTDALLDQARRTAHNVYVLWNEVEPELKSEIYYSLGEVSRDALDSPSADFFAGRVFESFLTSSVVDVENRTSNSLGEDDDEAQKMLERVSIAEQIFTERNCDLFVR